MIQHEYSVKTLRILIFIALCAALLIATGDAITLSPGTSFSSASTITNGDSVYIQGVATGHPANGLQVWLLGNNYVQITTVPVESDNTYEYELKPADTQNLAPGQYFVLIQHPMMNGAFDIYYDSSTGQVFNRQLGTGTAIFQLTGTGSLQTPSGANALMNAINSQNIDDTFATASFIISSPSAFVNPVGDHYVGDQFTVGGQTNLAGGDKLQVEITSSSFGPTKKSQDSGFSGSTGIVQVVAGNGSMNQWSFPVDASSYKPDEYIVRVSGVSVDVTGSTTFTILEKPVTAIATPTSEPATLVQTTGPTLAPTTVPPATTQADLPVMAVFAALGLAACGILLKKK